MTAITLKTVTMKDGSQKAKLLTDYNADLVKRCRQLGGSWNSEAKAWYFPTDLVPQLRQVCVDIYGIDPLAETPVDLVDVRLAYDPAYDTGTSSDSFWLFGREILRRPGRDTSVRPGEGVSILAGGFRHTGGSARYPSLGDAQDGTTLLIRGVPRATALAFCAEHAEDAVAIVERVEPQTLLLQEAKAAAGTLADLLKKLGKDEQDLVIHQLITAIQKQDA
jgi:hypothetical protein